MIKSECVEYREEGHEYFTVHLHTKEWFVTYIKSGDEDNIHPAFTYRITNPEQAK